MQRKWTGVALFVSLFVSSSSTYAEEVIKNEFENNESNVVEWFKEESDGKIPNTNESVLVKTPLGHLDIKSMVAQFKDEGGHAIYRKNEMSAELSISPALQKIVDRNLNELRTSAAAVVIIDSTTGRVLALSEKQNSSNSLTRGDGLASTSAHAPAASLMKIVTATAALEVGDVKASDTISFRGGCIKLRGDNWLRDEKKDRASLTFAQAFGKSCNTVFARLGIYWTDLPALRSYAEKYFFNKPLVSDIPMETSVVRLPKLEQATSIDVAEFAAGFGASKLSPIHAALLSAVTGNKGVLMSPYLIQQVKNAKGETVYKAEPRVLGKVYDAQYTPDFLNLMRATVTNGTSRKVFSRKGTRQFRAEIGGKTGTLSGPEERKTLYTWFSGLAPLDNPQNIAIGCLVASPQNYVVRASALAQKILTDILKTDVLEMR